MTYPYPLPDYDKDFPVGPWSSEPNVHAWTIEDNGEKISCAIIRMPHRGHLCGYVRVPDAWIIPSNPDNFYSCHGGVTYEEDRWLGFDCAHACDLVPADSPRPYNLKNKYCSFNYVVTEVNRLASQLHAVSLSLSRTYVVGNEVYFNGKLYAKCPSAEMTTIIAHLLEKHHDK